MTITNVHAYNAGEAVNSHRLTAGERRNTAAQNAYDAKSREDYRKDNPQNFDADGNRIKRW